MRFLNVALTSLLLPALAYAAPTPQDSNVVHLQDGDAIANEFLVMFTNPVPAAHVSRRADGSTVSPAEESKAAEEAFLTSILDEVKVEPSTNVIFANANPATSQSAPLVESIPLASGERTWLVRGPSDLPERINRNGE
ncbi:hypothetical protein HK102_004871, partial [Quaeritorhiza haematococci]